jgi:ribosome biogenesis protein ENP2
MSADKKIIKIWDEADGKAWTSVEPMVDLNHIAWCRDSGMLLTANEGKQQHAFFIPQLGPAPKWCSFLDNMVEEMAEEAPAETYDNYKFLTLPELKTLNLSHLIGTTNLLRPYMHGYFVASRLYEEARLIANPYIWDEERTKRVKERVEKERASRIRGKKVKVNQNLVDKLLKKQERREKVDENVGVLGDSRFGKLFEDEDFAVDERSKEFQALNPSTVASGNITMVEKAAVDISEESQEDDDSEEEAELKARQLQKPEMRISSSSYKKSGHQRRDQAFGARKPSSGRVSKQRGEITGERSVTFAPKSGKKEKNVETVKSGRRDEGRRSASGNVFRKM